MTFLISSSLPFRSLPNIAKDKPLIKHAWKAADEDEEKFQREIMGEEPNLIKLYLAQRGDRNSWNGTSRDLYESGEGSFSESEPMKKVGKVLFAFRVMLNKESSGKLILRWRDPDK